MTNIRRYWQAGQTVFLTHITLNREPLLVAHVDLLQDAVMEKAAVHKCEVVAWVIMPDHMHLLLRPGGGDVSKLVSSIKLAFSTRLRRRFEVKSGRVWQYRFWDRVIRDEVDLNRHVDYIHYNPVKHGFVNDPYTWPHSSLGAYYEKGLYQRDWGVVEPVDFDGEFGE